MVRARVHTHLTLKRQTDVLKRLVFIDALTHAFNRRYFDERLAEEWGRAQRTGRPLGLILIDVDYFKQFNDVNGHQRGDDALRQVAQALKETILRPGDVVCRYGGEEFACLLPDTDLDGALQVAQRMKLAVRALAIGHPASAVAEVLTISVGVAVCTPELPGRCRRPAGPGRRPALPRQGRGPGAGLPRGAGLRPGRAHAPWRTCASMEVDEGGRCPRVVAVGHVEHVHLRAEDAELPVVKRGEHVAPAHQVLHHIRRGTSPTPRPATMASRRNRKFSLVSVGDSGTSWRSPSR